MQLFLGSCTNGEAPPEEPSADQKKLECELNQQLGCGDPEKMMSNYITLAAKTGDDCRKKAFAVIDANPTGLPADDAVKRHINAIVEYSFIGDHYKNVESVKNNEPDDFASSTAEFWQYQCL